MGKRLTSVLTILTFAVFIFPTVVYPLSFESFYDGFSDEVFGFTNGDGNSIGILPKGNNGGNISTPAGIEKLDNVDVSLQDTAESTYDETDLLSYGINPEISGMLDIAGEAISNENFYSQADYFYFFSDVISLVTDYFMENSLNRVNTQIANEILNNKALIDLLNEYGYNFFNIKEPLQRELLERIRGLSEILNKIAGEEGFTGSFDLSFTYKLKDKDGSQIGSFHLQKNLSDRKWQVFLDEEIQGEKKQEILTVLQSDDLNNLLDVLQLLDFSNDVDDILPILNEIKQAIEAINDAFSEMGYTGELDVSSVYYTIYEVIEKSIELEYREGEEGKKYICIEKNSDTEPQYFEQTNELIDFLQPYTKLTDFSELLKELEQRGTLSVEIYEEVPVMMYTCQKSDNGELELMVNPFIIVPSGIITHKRPQFLLTRGIIDYQVQPTYIFDDANLIIELNILYEHLVFGPTSIPIIASITKNDSSELVFHLDAIPYPEGEELRYTEDVGDYIEISFSNIQFIPGTDRKFVPLYMTQDRYGFDYNITIYDAQIKNGVFHTIRGSGSVPVSE